MRARNLRGLFDLIKKISKPVSAKIVKPKGLEEATKGFDLQTGLHEATGVHYRNELDFHGCFGQRTSRRRRPEC
jgi:hypothetical protein